MHPSLVWETFKLKLPLKVHLRWKILIHLVFFGLTNPIFLGVRNFFFPQGSIQNKEEFYLCLHSLQSRSYLAGFIGVLFQYNNTK